MERDDVKARAEAVFAHGGGTGNPSRVEQEAEAVRAKMARLKALREAREKAEMDRAETARARARLARAPKGV